MNTPSLICNQIPCRDIPYLRSKRLSMVRNMACVYWGLALILAACSFFEPTLLVLTCFFVFAGVFLLLWARNILRLCNTVELYDDTILLRGYRGEVIRTVNYKSVLYADTVTLCFASKNHRNPAFRAKGLYLCIWLAETPPLFEDDAFLELAKWEELFLLAHDERAEAILREKVRFTQK